MAPLNSNIYHTIASLNEVYDNIKNFTFEKVFEDISEKEEGGVTKIFYKSVELKKEMTLRSSTDYEKVWKDSKAKLRLLKLFL